MGAQTSITQSQTSNQRPLQYITPKGKIYTKEINRNQRHIFTQLCVNQAQGMSVALTVSLSQCARLSKESGVYLQQCAGPYSAQPRPLFDRLTLFLSEVEKCAALAIQQHLDLLCSLRWNERRERMCVKIVCVSMGKMSLRVCECLKSISCCCFFLPAILIQ